MSSGPPQPMTVIVVVGEGEGEEETLDRAEGGMCVLRARM